MASFGNTVLVFSHWDFFNFNTNLMIYGQPLNLVSYDEIRKKLSEYQIYRYYLGYDFKLKYPVTSPFHKDENPSFSIFCTRDGVLYHQDFSSPLYRGTAVDFVMQLFGLNYGDALNKIAADFGIRSKTKDYIRIVQDYTEPKIEAQKNTIIQVITQKPTRKYLEYWGEYHLSEDDLREDGTVFCVKKIYLNRKRFPLPEDELVIGYLFNGRYWKIYRPHAINKKEKWLNNTPLITMYGLQYIQKCSTSIVVKSKKDQLVARKYLTRCAAGTQNESVVAISNENISYLQEHSKETYIIFDNDQAGIEACRAFNQFGFKYWNIPKKYYLETKTKDIADMVRNYGPDRLIEEFSKKIKL